MAIPVARVHLAMSHAALPALLPTPAKTNMLPVLAAPCVLILPMSPPKATSPSKGSRADADERWDARKSAIIESPSKPGRADAVGRWDAHKITPASPSSPCSSQRSSDSRRSSGTSSSSSSSSPPTGRASSFAARWDSNKRAINRASSAERWDAHKKPRLPLAEELHGGQTSTGSNDMEVHMPQPHKALYAGSGFLASPEPSMLPMPSFMVRSAA